MDSRTKAKWMVLTILAPEYLLGKALGERMAAVHGYMHRQRGSDTVTEWDSTHAYYANMGGFILDFTKIIAESRSNNQTSPSMPDDPQSATMEVLRRPSETSIEMEALHISAIQRPLLSDDDDSSSNWAAAASEPLQGLNLEVSAFELEIDLFLSEHMDIGASQKTNLLALKQKAWALTTEQLGYALASRLISEMPKVSTKSLNKLGTADNLVKVITVIKVSWLIIQLIARRVAHLPSTQLEIATLAFSVMSIITYILYWGSPQGVQTVCIIEAARLPEQHDFGYLAEYGPTYTWTLGRNRGMLDGEYGFVPIPNDASFWSSETKFWIRRLVGWDLNLVQGAVYGGIAFGGLHCLAWDFEFPTPQDALTWKVCAILTISLPFPFAQFLLLWKRISEGCNRHLYRPYYPDDSREGLRRTIGIILIWVFIVPYILARLFILVEIFRTLFYQPPEVFINTWSGKFPGWG